MFTNIKLIYSYNSDSEALESTHEIQTSKF